MTCQVRAVFAALLCVFLNVCSALICPDGGMCEDGNTCCQTPTGGYGCCPLPNAECCSDHLHCCYEGTLCDLEHSKCVNKTHVLDWVVRVAAKQQAVVCPDQVSECPDDTTCCQMPDGSWGCCPMKNAVCCEDKRHCCPEGTTCDLEHSMCLSDTYGPSPLWRKFAAHRRMPLERKAEKIVPCNETVACESGTTCCKTEGGTWACCPLPEAVCCEDHAHCCPHGTVCNLAAATCDDPADLLMSVPWVKKVSTFPIAPESPNQKCDETMSCPGDSTCCKLLTGGWGCCPLPQAICCEDHLHCCPHDTVCNLAASTCDSASDQGPRFSVPLVRKIAAVTLPSQNQNCDETSLCPTGTTCCKLNTGAWGCCPLSQAVCCDDQEHCCPQTYKCDLTHKTCVYPGLTSIPWLKKQPALSVTQQSEPNVVAPALAGKGHRHMCDDHTSCPRDDTCCFMNKLGKWGCCPLPKAVCCKDGDHCCPSGYTCNEKKTSCTKDYHEIPWYRKQEARVTERSEVLSGVEDVKCDSTTSCASGSTCCKLPTGEWGCCPLVKAVCCYDHKHCCPQGYTCNLEFGTCIKPSDVHTVALIQKHRHSNTQSEEEVVCDASTRCSNTQTCCRLSDTTWACCPYKEAVCCNDMKHCCPMGYKCDPKVKGCTKESSLTWWENSL
ncbi:progranulin-like [Myxocyprinus asiaticus]|uniref:progranulin-like n=1 Tax=Myxocyprinus asiaticus TaxID=70543 RepID=UPI002223E55A|nr:progranulin-like [Myxocyprinus asiaticus]XP_051537975.1 progranulin-like [Myxocyprinus asiaticus]XP_051537976.1 progranulin-like [Myxocyprinus asiaticus]XP_051537977.1 progranulin-like [Myxocyprinus asiaticus]